MLFKNPSCHLCLAQDAAEPEPSLMGSGRFQSQVEHSEDQCVICVMSRAQLLLGCCRWHQDGSTAQRSQDLAN